MQTTSPRSGHLPINGLDLFCEMHGEVGTSETLPLLLIPGAFMATNSMTSWVNAFADNRAVMVFDQQGHGRTPDTTREMSYEQFADDAAGSFGPFISVDRGMPNRMERLDLVVAAALIGMVPQGIQDRDKRREE